MAEVIWTEPALGQLEAIVEFIALDKPEAAQRVAQRIFAATDNLESFLRLGRSIPEFSHRDYRQVWMKPCWIYYRIQEDRIVILHVRRAEQLFRPDELLSDD
jgi:plasmid stabilization system protein ParE